MQKLNIEWSNKRDKLMKHNGIINVHYSGSNTLRKFGAMKMLFVATIHNFSIRQGYGLSNTFRFDVETQTLTD